MKNSIKPLFLTVTEVAKILRIQRAKVYILIESGTLAAYKVGSDWRIPTQSLESIVGLLPESLFAYSPTKGAVLAVSKRKKELERCI